jgi:hypothetical protein
LSRNSFKKPTNKRFDIKKDERKKSAMRFEFVIKTMKFLIDYAIIIFLTSFNKKSISQYITRQNFAFYTDRAAIFVNMRAKLSNRAAQFV